MAISLTEADTGRRVIYRPAHGAEERGSIFRVNPVTLKPYVLYEGERLPKLTEPSDLEWDEREGRVEVERAVRAVLAKAQEAHDLAARLQDSFGEHDAPEDHLAALRVAERASDLMDECQRALAAYCGERRDG